MSLETKIKKAAVMAAVDISLKRMKRSPERCTRNLLELGSSAYPNQFSKEEESLFIEQLLLYCKDNDSSNARILFIDTFIKEQA